MFMDGGYVGVGGQSPFFVLFINIDKRGLVGEIHRSLRNNEQELLTSRYGAS